MSQNSNYFTLQFVEFVRCSQKQKAKDLIKNVRKEIKLVNQMKDLNDEHKNTITLLEKMIENMKSDKFKAAQEDHRKVKNGFNKIVKERLTTRQREISDVEKLPSDVAKPWQPKRGEMGGRSTRKKEKIHFAHNREESNNQTGGSLQTEGSNSGPRTRSSLQPTNEERDQGRISSRRKQDSARAVRQLSTLLDEEDVEQAMTVHKWKSERDTVRQNQESTKEPPSEKNMFALHMETNNPGRVKNMFEPLHDNEWVDAFNVLGNITKQTDIEIAKQLLDIVNMAYIFCRGEAEVQLNVIVEKMCCIVVSGQQEPCKEKFKSLEKGDIDLLKQYRLHQADCALDNLFSKFVTKHIKSNGRHVYQQALQNNDFKKYIERCVQVTWLMSVQDPPTTVLSTDRFEPNMYQPPPRNYSPEVEYIEWPALMYGDNILALGKAKYKRSR